ncbi:MAG: Fic family protein [bacterium]|nr:Fic family protein [bacterium]
MENLNPTKPFKYGFLSEFVLLEDSLPFTNIDIELIDKKLSRYEEFILDPDIERNLISKNELLTSFAISKAENSELTIDEAKNVYLTLLSNKDYDFVKEKMLQGEKLNRNDYDKLEFFNIAKTFREIGGASFKIEDLTPDFIKNIHKKITQGLDIFKDHLSGFTVYKSGELRSSDDIRIGEYAPAPFNEIGKSIEEIINWYKNNKSPVSTAIFHTALYALHPFNNGNKRVCRILEHILLRELGLNNKNTWSTSYYYHKEKERYYKNMFNSLVRKNLNIFSAFALEAQYLSIVGVLKTSIETKKEKFLKINLREQREDELLYKIIKPLIKRKEIQFKNLFRFAKNKTSKQTFVNHLEKALERGLILKRENGKNTYYFLNLDIPEQKILEDWIILAKKKLPYISNGFLLA